MPHTRRKNIVSNTQKSSIQTSHTDLERCTTQYTFKIISTDLTRHIKKNKEKDSNRLNASLITSALVRIQLPGSRERHTQMGVTLVTKFGCALGAIVLFFVDSVQILRAISLDSEFNSFNAKLYWTSWPVNMGAVTVQLDKMIINV